MLGVALRLKVEEVGASGSRGKEVCMLERPRENRVE